MRIWYLSIGVAVLTLCGWMAVSRRIDRNVEFVPASNNLGELRQGETIQCEVSLVNSLREPVSVVAVRSSCKCTVPPESLVGAYLEPSESLSASLAFQTGGSDGMSSGSVVVVLRGADSGHNYLTQTMLMANVRPDYMIAPKTLDFGVATSNAPISREIRLISVAERTQLRSIKVSHPEFSVTAQRPSEGDGDLVRIEFRAPLSSKTRSFSALATLETSSVRAPTAKVFLRARYEPPVTVDPPSIVFSAVVGEYLKTVILSTAEAANLRVVSAPAGVNVAVKNNGESNIQALDVSLTKTYGSLHGEIELEVNVGGKKLQVNIPVDFINSNKSQMEVKNAN